MNQNTDLGQHFMTDEALLKRIVDIADIAAGEKVLEIGSGGGALSKILLGKTTQLLRVEVDERYEADIHANILDVIDELDFESVVSNLPYHILEPLFMKLSILRPKKILVVVGERFARHLVEETILGSVFKDIYDVLVLENISPESFDPPPRVRSVLLKCTLKGRFGILSNFYAYPKSKVKNYIKTKTAKKDAKEFINKLPLPLTEKRLYELSLQDFLQLVKVLRELE